MRRVSLTTLRHSRPTLVARNTVPLVWRKCQQRAERNSLITVGLITQQREVAADAREKETIMQFSVYPHEDNSGDWVVEAIDIDGEGEILTAIFSGRDAQSRAESYVIPTSQSC